MANSVLPRLAGALLVCASLAATAPAASQSGGNDAIPALIERGAFAEARSILETRVAAGDVEAMARLAELEAAGQGGAQDFARAAALNRAAAEAGHAGAQNALGRALAEGRGVEADAQAAMVWLRRAAEAGDPRHQTDYAVALEAGIGGPARPEDAVSWYEAAAAQGFVEAMTSLGVLYLEGNGVAPDARRAMSYFEEAAALDDPRGLNNLGLMLVRGEAVERDYERAFALFERAAELGLSEGFSNLSVMYANGFGVPVDEAESERLLQLSRAAGSQLLPALLDRLGVPFDERLAPIAADEPVSLDERAAADAGDPVALYRRAWRRMSGLGTRPDLVGAVTDLEAASRRGLGSAQLTLGLLYARGAGVPQDYRTAYVWASLAAVSGHPQAALLRDALASELPYAVVESAQMDAQAYLEGGSAEARPD